MSGLESDLESDLESIPDSNQVHYPNYYRNIRTQRIFKIVMYIVGGNIRKAHIMLDDIVTLMKQPEIIAHYRTKEERLEKSRLYGVIPRNYDCKKTLYKSFSDWQVAENALYVGADTKNSPAYLFSDSTKLVYIVSKKNGRYWFVINNSLNDDTLYEISIYAPEQDINDEKYLAKLERCIASMKR